MKKHILLIALEKAEFYNQALFLIISVLAVSNKSSIQIHIYSDSDEWLPKHLSDCVKLNIISKNDLKAFKGPHSFVHRVKIILIKKLCSENTGKILYIDTDCFCIKSLELLYIDIGANSFVMHRREYAIDSTIDLTAQNQNSIDSLIQTDNQPDNVCTYYMWNAGVIGGEASYLLPLCDAVLEMTDMITARTEMHTAEQFAFSVCFQRNGNIKPADHSIHHYWDRYEKQYMRKYINDNINIYTHLQKQNRSNILKFTLLLMKYRIRYSYLYNKAYAIERFECNAFISGYGYMLRAFISRPCLDSDFKTKLYQHTKRYTKHMSKKVVKW